MRKKLKHKFLSLLMSISLLPFGNIVSAQGTLNIDSTTSQLQSLSETYSVDTSELEHQIQEGYSINDIQNALKLQKETAKNYQSILENLHPDVMNISDQAVSQITKDISAKLPFQIKNPGTRSTTIDPSKLLTTLKAKPNEAPYRVSSNQESISTVSGGLTYQETDAIIPGRNGLSFSLTRTYNSQNAQEYDMDVAASYDFNYYVQIPVMTKKEQKIYKAKTIMKAYQEEDIGCRKADGDPPDTRTYIGGSLDKEEISPQEFLNRTDASKQTFNNVITPWSKVQCVDPNPAEPPILGAPTGLTVTNQTQNSIGLRWNSVSGATGYNIYNGESSIGSTSNTGYTVSGLKANTSYTLSVAAYNDNGESGKAPISVTTSGEPEKPPSKPEAPSIYYWKYESPNSITVYWYPISGALSYKVYVDGQLKDSTSSTSTFIDRLSIKTHTIEVSAVNSVGEGLKSSPIYVPVVDCSKNPGMCPFSNQTINTVPNPKKKTRISYYADPVTVYEDAKVIDSKPETVIAGPYTQQEADELINEIKTYPNNLVLDYTEWEKVDGKEIREVQTLNGASTKVGPIQENPYYYNKAVSSKKTPIGTGWSWNIPYLDTKVINGTSKKFVSLGDGTVYEVDGSLLKGDIWNQYSFQSDTSMSITDPQASDPSDNQSKYVVTTIDGKNYYFNEKGNLIVISDSYGNQITFYYKVQNPYGTVIRSIKDSIGNEISIDYTKDPKDGTDLVVIKNGAKQVTYRKGKINNLEVLAKVINASGTKTFDYSEKQAKFNLLQPNPEVSNPYILLTGITHPTQAKTVYTYEDTPVTYYTGGDSVNQMYKVQSRYDEVYYTNNQSKKFNKVDYSYPGDTGKLESYTFHTIKKGLTTTTYTIEKEYKDANTPPAYYINEEKDEGNVTTRITSYTYDKKKGNPYPKTIQTKNLQIDGTGKEVSSKEISITREYQYGRVIYENNPLQQVSTEYTLNNITLDIPIPNKSTTSTKFTLLLPKKETLVNFQSDDTKDQTIETTYDYEFNQNGNVKKRSVTLTSNSQTLSKDESSVDQYGNVSNIVKYKNIKDNGANEKLIEDVNYDSSNHAFVSEINMNVKNADGNNSTIKKSFVYEPSTGNLTSYVDGNGNKTLFEYDLLDRVKKITYVNPNDLTHPEKFPTIMNDYNDSLNEIVTTNEMGEKSKQTWNPLGWKSGEYIYQDNQYQSKEQIEYDDYGRVYQTTDAKGNVTRSIFDEWNRPIINYAADYSYDPITKIETGGKTTYAYDDIRHVISTIDNNQNILEETYDDYGRILQKSKKWTDLNNVNQIETFETYSYTGDDYQIEDAKGYKTKFEYDALGQLSSVTYPASLPNIPNDQKYTYHYDLMGNLDQITYQDQKILTKTYDELGRLLSEKDPAGNVEKYYYDGNDNLVTRKDKNQNEFTNVYDYRNFQTAKLAPSGSILKDKVEYQYDNTGRIVDMTEYSDSSPKTTHYEYYTANDPEIDKYVGLLKKKTVPDGSTFAYKYNKGGSQSQVDIQIGETKWSMKYGYDKMDRMQSVNASIPSLPQENINETYAYQNNGLLKRVTRSGDSEKNLIYNGLLLDTLSDRNTKSGNLFSSISYGYDKNENITSIKNDNNLQKFSYDELNRILHSDIDQEEYTYDNRGNRQTLQSNKLPDSKITQYEYDIWDSLSKVTTEAGKSVEYQYNGDGLMVERTENGVTNRYYYDGEDIVAEGKVQPDGKVTSIVRYLRGADGLIARISEDPAEKTSYGGIAYYQKNGHGDIIALRDKNGSLLNSYSYDIWGNIQSEGTKETISNPFLYSGEYWDKTTNLQYLRARWYDPNMGRFISEDSYKGDNYNPLSLNFYTYVENNPLTQWDPSGHIPVFQDGNGEGSAIKMKDIPEMAENSYLEMCAKKYHKICALENPLVPFAGAINDLANNGNNQPGGNVVSKNTIKGTGNIVRLGEDGIKYAVSNPSRMQHAFKHAKDLDFGNWNKQTAQQWNNYVSNVLKTATKSFDNMLGQDAVKGFYKVDANGYNVAVYVYKSGPNAGRVASVVRLTDIQMIKFRLK